MAAPMPVCRGHMDGSLLLICGHAQGAGSAAGSPHCDHRYVITRSAGNLNALASWKEDMGNGGDQAADRWRLQ